MTTPRPRTQERRRRTRRSLARDTATARESDLRLARLHLVTGLLSLARAEFESLVASGPLGAPALADLAEIRWRTGDLPGAGDAAAAHLEAGGVEGRALAIAAEAAAAIGRTAEAERLAIRAVERLDRTPLAFFAGIPMSAVWPAEVLGPGSAASVATSADAALVPEVSIPEASPPEAVVPGASDELVGLARPARPADASDIVSDPIVPIVPEPASTGADEASPPDEARDSSADAFLPSIDPAAAAMRRAIALRLDPGLAAVVIEETASAADPASLVLRGDAFRLLGREAEAQAAFAAASETLGAGAADEPVPEPGQDPDGDPDVGAVR